MQNDNVIRVKPDTLIAMAVMEAEALDMNRLPSLQQMNKEFDPSEAFCKRMEKLMTKTNAKEKLKEGMKKAKKYTLAFTVLCTLFFGALLPAHAVQASIVQTVTEWYDGFTGWLYAGSRSVTEAVPQNILLACIPDGFALAETPYISEAEYAASYISSTGKRLCVRALRLESEQFDTLDNEQMDFYPVMLGNTTATLGIVRGGDNMLLFWQKNGLLFKVYGTAGAEDILRVGGNINANL